MASAGLCVVDASAWIEWLTGCAASKPLATCTPAACNRARPRPATCGLGSGMAAITRATPAAISASAQGGVRP